MLQGFLKKSFSIVNWPIFRSSTAMRRAASAVSWQTIYH
jgi:hypothetical protein